MGLALFENVGPHLGGTRRLDVPLDSKAGGVSKPLRSLSVFYAGSGFGLDFTNPFLVGEGRRIACRECDHKHPAIFWTQSHALSSPKMRSDTSLFAIVSCFILGHQTNPIRATTRAAGP